MYFAAPAWIIHRDFGKQQLTVSDSLNQMVSKNEKK